MNFMERLSWVIDRSGLGKIEFSQLVGIGRRQLFYYLEGKATPRHDFYLKLKEAFSWVDLDWLIAGESRDSNEQRPGPNDTEIPGQFVLSMNLLVTHDSKKNRYPIKVKKTLCLEELQKLESLNDLPLEMIGAVFKQMLIFSTEDKESIYYLDSTQKDVKISNT